MTAEHVSYGGQAEILPVGTPVMVASPQWGVMVGVVEATDQTVPGLGHGAYSVRMEDGLGLFCLPPALFDLRPVAARTSISIHREAGNA